LAAERSAAGADEKSPLPISDREVGLQFEIISLAYFFSAVVAAAGFPPLIGIIACSYGVPAHIA
jgi:hypothetical protein